MPIKKVPGYSSVTFRDSGNQKKVTYEMPNGTKIGTSKNHYEVKKDGVYNKGKKVDCIDVPLQNMVALEVFDANKDKRIDPKDNQKLGKKGDYQFAYDISSALSKRGSKYTVDAAYTKDGGGWIDAHHDKKGFSVIFSDKKDVSCGEKKPFDIKFQ